MASSPLTMLVSVVCFLLALLVLITSHGRTLAQPNFLKFFCGTYGNTTAHSTPAFQDNLRALLFNLSFDMQVDYGFYNFSNGEGPDRVNAIVLCRGDVTPQDCRSCISDSRFLLPQACPNMTEAIGWYDNCMLRFSNRTIFQRLETVPVFYLWNTERALEQDKFNEVLNQSLNSLRERAAAGDSHRMFASANWTGPSNQTIYGLVQCTPDLSKDECNSCLRGAISDLPKCCARNRGGRVVRPSCSIRFEIYGFFDTSV